MLIRIEVAVSILKRFRKNGWISADAARVLDITDQLVSQIVNTEFKEVSRRGSDRQSWPLLADNV